MDKNQTLLGALLIFIGAGGVFLTYAGVSKTFEEGLQALSILVVLFGAMLFSGGLFKGGLPSLEFKYVAVIGAVVAVSLGGLTYSAITGYGPFTLLTPPPPPAAESPVIVYVSIIPGSWNPNQPDSYVPRDIRVVLKVNNTVVWTNNEDLDIAHTVTDDNFRFDSGLFGKGVQYKYTFVSPGLYRYHCIPHPWMRGSVDVSRLTDDEVNRILEQLGIKRPEGG
ncbi:MAG: plastocyanin/azurin family copper-binding protein [Aigarchaeota archaeon]|nr:plastocyanin/azurin family copper-binding protein [Aigarchaeota archaeon]MDW8092328.1 plastocyanin/azurin family copper-binding protein [Nitrososphaerota archaeon]